VEALCAVLMVSVLPTLAFCRSVGSHFTYLGRGFASGRFAGGLLVTSTRHDDAYISKFDDEESLKAIFGSDVNVIN
jgi:hypothetical protein